MLQASDTAWAPWFVVDSNDKKKARLNIIAHLLSYIPYEHLALPKVDFPARQKPNGYTVPRRVYHYVEDRYGKAD